MKKSIIISSLLLVVAMVIDAEQKEFPKLTGPYLGQRLPDTTPELFAPGIISTGLHEGVCTFMPDGNEIIFNVLYRKPHSHSVYSSLVASRLVNGQWAPPEVLKFSGGKNLDTAPFISYDGKELFFESNRPTNRADLKNKTNIWRCSRTPAGWSDPEPLPSPINGRGNVFGPSMSSSGAFYFTLADAKGNSAIYASHFSAGKFSEPKRLPECVNVKQGTFDGVISPDGSYYIVCVYNKEDSLGETDMYITFKDERSDWTPLKNLGKAINTERNDGSAKISPDGKIIFFAGCLVSHNYYNDALTYADILNNILKPQYGNSDIYWISAEFIEALRSKAMEGMIKDAGVPEKSKTVREPLTLARIANSGVMLAAGGTKVLIDALFDKPHANYRSPAPETLEKIMTGVAPFDGVDLVLVTHNHPDHFNSQLAVKFLEANFGARLVVPADAAEEMRKEAADWTKIAPRVVSFDLKVNEMEKRDLPGFSLTAFRTLHSGKRDEPMNLMYQLQFGGWSVFHEGDAEATIDEYRGFGLEGAAIDLALVHFWFPLDPNMAKLLQEVLRPAHVGLTHLPIRLEGDAPSKIDMVRQHYKDIFLLLPGMPVKTFREGQE